MHDRRPQLIALAEVVSAACNPVVYTTLLLGVMLATGGFTRIGPYIFAWLLLAVLPGGLLMVGIRRGIWSDVDVSELKERRTFLPWVLLSSTVVLVSAWMDRFPQELRFAVTGIFIWLLISVVLSIFWKVSLHVGATAGVVAMVLVVFGVVPALWLAWSPFLVGWARIYLRKHDPWQVLGGFGVASLSMWVAAAFVHP